VAYAGGAADNHGGLSLQIENGRTHAGAVFFQDSSAAVGLTVVTLRATLSLYLRQSAGGKKWLPKKSSG
jgi:hypothetical protein